MSCDVGEVTERLENELCSDDDDDDDNDDDKNTSKYRLRKS